MNETEVEFLGLAAEAIEHIKEVFQQDEVKDTLADTVAALRRIIWLEKQGKKGHHVIVEDGKPVIDDYEEESLYILSEQKK